MYENEIVTPWWLVLAFGAAMLFAAFMAGARWGAPSHDDAYAAGYAAALAVAQSCPEDAVYTWLEGRFPAPSGAYGCVALDYLIGR